MNEYTKRAVARSKDALRIAKQTRRIMIAMTIFNFLVFLFCLYVVVWR